jgi:hypothetical protein|tara:strand:+ start:374 stop:601 length:228 start_codon:yes stop_codon:yes gene_type:complete
MSDFNLRSVIRQEITKALEKRGGPAARDEIARLQQTKSVAQAFGFAGPGFGGYEKGPTSHGPGGTKGFLGPGFKK